MTEPSRQKGNVHARVHFRRHELPSLDSLPSAAAAGVPPNGRKPVFGRALKVTGAAVAAILVIVALAIGGLWLAINAGFGRERIVMEAEAALARIYGFPVKAGLSGTTLSFDGGRYVAVELRDVAITHAETGKPLTSASAIRLGIRLLPLLGGDVRIGSVRVDQAHAGEELAGGEAGDVMSVLAGADGLAEPDRIAALVFDAARDAFAKLDVAGTRRIALRSTRIERQGVIHDVTRLILTRDSADRLDIDLEARSGTLAYTLEASATRNSDKAITALQADLKLSELAMKSSGVAGISAGPVTISLTGSESGRGSGQRLLAKVSAENYKAAIEVPDELAGRLSFVAEIAQGSGKIDLSSGYLAVNNSQFPFTGAIGPDPAGREAASEPRYRFEFVTNEARLSPLDTNEQAITLGARLAGQVIPSSRTVNLSDMTLRTSGGEVLGTLRLVFGDSAPAIFLAVRSHDLPVSHAKQLWPWLSAPKAREWVVKNLFDGTLKSTRLELSSGPGRLTDGIPFSKEEIGGRFEVTGTRFDIAGDLPPVRDADGVVSFAGNDVEILLSKGTAWMPSGRTVAARDGRMDIRDAHLDPVIGKLELQVEGNAAAIVELASRKPIDAGEKLGIGPEKFSGTAKGTVRAAIPLEDDVRVADIDWSVALDVAGLSIDEDFDGQKLTSADGRLTIDPKAARFTAKGKLNGLDAQLSIVEPLEPGKVKAEQEITLELTSRTLSSLAPGLDGIVSGPVSVKLSGAGEAKTVEADLARAALTIPWVGWSKGEGIPAKARFVIEEKGRNTSIRNLSIQGKSFDMAGSINLVDDDVISLSMSKVRLNRDDDFSVSMTRGNGGAIAIAIKGNSMDARAAVRQFSSAREEALKKVDRTPMTISARLDRVTGFSGEALNNVRLDYQGTGDTPVAASMTGVTGRGAAFSIIHSGGSNRSLEMNTGDAGSLLRFLDIYGRMRGGNLKVALFGAGKGPLKGQIDVRDFTLVDEPRLASLVGRPAPQSDGRSLNDVVRKEIDVSKVKFDRGFVIVEKGEKYLSMERGVLRGPLIGTTFQGNLYDARGRMSVTGTFMPAYGLNRIFGEIPVLGFVLGNGRDRGLIGITYKLAGDAKSPDLQINPMSVIAPGIFRSIFEFR